MLLSKCTILITGGTSGVGYELVSKLYAAGHHLIVIARNTEKLAALALELPGISVYDCDLADGAALGSALDAIAAAHPDLSIVINNAAIQYATRLTAADFDHDMMVREVATNLIAPVRISQRLLANLIRRGGRCAIVNVSSGLAFYPKTDSTLYCATKAALHSFSQSLRYQLEGTTVAVIEAILPLVDTPMTEGRGTGELPAAEAADRIIAGIERDQAEIYVGKAKLIPLLMRVAPSLLRKSLKGS